MKPNATADALSRPTQPRPATRGRIPWVGTHADVQRGRARFSPADLPRALGLNHEAVESLEQEYFATRSLASDLSLIGRIVVFQKLFGDSSPPSPVSHDSKRQAPRHPQPWIVASRICDVTVRDALKLMVEPHEAPRARMIFFAHAHALCMARTDRSLREAFESADAVFGDGIGIRMASALLARPLQANLNGTDLLPLLCGELVSMQKPLVLVGATPDVVRRCADNLRRDHPGLMIPVALDGFGLTHSPEQVNRAIQSIGPAVVLVGMGSPLQEHFALQHLGSLPGSTVVTVGGLFDFFAGRIPRAPRWMRQCGLEWTYPG